MARPPSSPFFTASSPGNRCADWWVESEILSDLHIHITRSIKSSQKDVGQTSKKQAPTIEGAFPIGTQ